VGLADRLLASARAGDLWDREPCTGKLPEALAPRLAEALAVHTEHPDRCHFGVWEGWGEPGLMFLFKEGTPEEVQRPAREKAEAEFAAEFAAWRALLDAAPTFDLPQRRMHLLEGSLDAMPEFYERHRNPPSLWWPEDRAWCVATDIDLMTTYIGGSSEAIQALLDDDQIEALAVSDDQSVTWEADMINPPPLPPN
jgi:hypothetical protein